MSFVVKGSFGEIEVDCIINGYKQTDAIFDENGYGYSTKLVKCKHCGRLNVIRYFEDDSMKLNNDRKYYDYDMV